MMSGRRADTAGTQTASCRRPGSRRAGRRRRPPRGSRRRAGRAAPSRACPRGGGRRQCGLSWQEARSRLRRPEVGSAQARPRPGGLLLGWRRQHALPRRPSSVMFRHWRLHSLPCFHPYPRLGADKGLLRQGPCTRTNHPADCAPSSRGGEFHQASLCGRKTYLFCPRTSRIHGHQSSACKGGTILPIHRNPASA